MLFRKTPATERSSYVYRFADGTKSVIAECDEAAVWIKTLHAMDDSEIYNNTKNRKPRRGKCQEENCPDWSNEKSKGGSWNLSLETILEEDEENNYLAKQMAQMSEEQVDSQKGILYECLAELSEEDQKLYDLYFREEYSQQEISGDMRLRRMARTVKTAEKAMAAITALLAGTVRAERAAGAVRTVMAAEAVRTVMAAETVRAERAARRILWQQHYRELKHFYDSPRGM